MAEYTVVSKEAEYTPEWDGNREKPDPIVVTLAYITAEQRSQCISGRRVAGDIAVAIDYGKAVRHGVRGIRGLVVNKKKVLTADDLMDLSGFDGLFMEIALRIWNMNAREDMSPLP